MSKATRRILITLLILSAGTGVLLYYWDDLVNYLAKRFILTEVSRRLGGEAKVKSVHAYLFPPQIEIQDLDVTMKEGSLRTFKVREIIVQPGVGPIFAGQIHIKKISVIDPYFKINLQNAFKEKKEKKKSKFRIPQISDFIKLNIDAFDLQGARLSLEMPGENVEVRVGQGTASYHGTDSKEEWSWKGLGEFRRKDQILSLEDFSIKARRDKDEIYIHEMNVKGLGVDATLAGYVSPSLDFSMTIKSDLKKVRDSVGQVYPKIPKDLQGQAIVKAKLKGELSRWSGSGSLELLKVFAASRRVDRLEAGFLFDQKELKRLEGKLLSQTVQLDFSAEAIAKNKVGVFKVSGRAMPYEDLEKMWIDPSMLTPTLKGNLDLSAQGQIGLSPFVLSGDYQIASPKLSLFFDNGLERFLPIKFDQVRIRGNISSTPEGDISLDAGELKTGSIEARYRFDFPRQGKIKGEWMGNVINLQSHFEPTVPFSGNGQISGGLEAEGENVQATLTLNIENASYAKREAHALQGSIIFDQRKVTLQEFTLRGEKSKLDLQAEFGEAAISKGFVKSKFSQFDLGWISDVVALRYPVVKGVEGIGEGHVYLSDIATEINGDLELTSSQSSWKGIDISQIEAQVGIAKGVTEIKKARIADVDKNTYAAIGKVSPTHYENLVISFKKFPLSKLDIPSPLQKLASHMDGSVALNGVLGDPGIRTALQLYRQDENQGYRWAGVGSTSGTLSKLLWSINIDGDTLDAEGDVDLKDYSFCKTRGRLDSFSLAPLFKDIPAKLTATWILDGDLKSINSWTGSVNLQSFETETTMNSLRLEKPVSLDLTQGVLLPTSISFLGDRTQLSARLSVDDDQNFLAILDGRIPLSILSYFKTGISRAEGILKTYLKLGGPINHIQTTGNFSTENALLQFVNFPHDVENATLRGTIDQNVIHVDEINATVGGGSVRASGNIDLDPDRSRISLTAYADKVSLRYPAFLPVNASGSLALVGPLSLPTLKGELTVHDARYEDEWDWKSKVLTFGAATRGRRILKAKEQNLLLDLHFVSEGNRFVLKNSIASGRLRADVRLVGSDQQMGVLGRVEVIQGTVEFLDNLFTLTSGVVVFDKPDDINPVFDINAKTRVQQYDILLDIRTEGEDITAFLSSQPVKDETNIIALLTIGVDTDELLVRRQDNNISSTVLPGVLSAPVQSKLQKGLRETKVLDSLQFVPFFSDQTQTTGLRMLVGKQFFPKVKLLYSTDLFNVGAENTVRLQQNFNDGISLQGSVRDNRQNQNEELDFGLDFEFKFDF